ncbi:MucB/RseB C-terminal domain-containing protein [bacterium]|nr:MucB/RseB C-terminal domain-containing protein [bacterium]
MILVQQLFKNLKLAALLAAVFAHGSLSAEQMESAYDLMARMAKASKELSYKGLFTYEYRGQLRSIKVVHLVRDGQTYERIVHMDGPEREIVRRGDNLDCLRAADMLLRGSSLKVNDTYAELEDYYEFYIRGDGRIAGRQVSLVEILPKDKLRYGYVVAIDKETGLMLQSVLLSQSGKPLERFQYVEISFATNLDNFQLSSEMAKSEDIDVNQSACLEANQEIEPVPSIWESQWLPPGFVLSSYQPEGADGQESWMYTDGLAVFSVFIDSTEGTRNFPPLDAKLGITIAVLTKTQYRNKLYAICVVGEIPRATAAQVANAIRPSAIGEVGSPQGQGN